MQLAPQESIRGGDFRLVRDARVRVKQITNSKGQNRAHFTIGDKRGEIIEHDFPATSRVSKHLDLMTAKDLEERYNGGTFFLINDTLVDFRDKYYTDRGFIHSDDSIKHFMDVLGFMYKAQLPLHRGSARKRNQEGESEIVLRRVWSESEIIVPGYAGGADFNSQLSFMWTPFTKTINSAFDLIRLICTNGMIGLTSFLNSKVPLLNLWEQHLDIASRQIQNKVESVVKQRIDRMALQRASIGDCLLLQEHAFERLHSPQTVIDDEDTYENLQRLMAAASPSIHLGGIYQDVVFKDKTLAKQLPAHLSQFDAFNIATELRTHTTPTTKSTDVALDKFANHILFDAEDDFTVAAGAIGATKTAAFSDPERAFFGQVGATDLKH